jgi:hypothetical protein
MEQKRSFVRIAGMSALRPKAEFQTEAIPENRR